MSSWVFAARAAASLFWLRACHSPTVRSTAAFAAVSCRLVSDSAVSLKSRSAYTSTYMSGVVNVCDFFVYQLN